MLHNILAQRDIDLEGWIDILIVIVIFVVSSLRILLRTKTEETGNKPGKQHQKHTQSSKIPDKVGFTGPSRNNRDNQRTHSIQKQHVYPRGFSKSPIPKSSIQKAHTQVSGRKSQSTTSKKTLEEKLIELNTVVPPTQKILYDLPEYTDDAVKKLQQIIKVPIESKKAVRKNEFVDDVSLSLDDFLDVSNPDEFKKAILCYEILGKPLSLRTSDL